MQPGTGRAHHWTCKLWDGTCRTSQCRLCTGQRSQQNRVAQFACLVSQQISNGMVERRLCGAAHANVNRPGLVVLSLLAAACAQRMRWHKQHWSTHIRISVVSSFLCALLIYHVSCMQVKANNLQLVLPHMTWTLPPAASASLKPLQQQPLHHMWELLTTALGYNTPIDPHVAVGMLLSAAAVGPGGSSGGCAGLRQSEQVRIWQLPWLLQKRPLLQLCTDMQHLHSGTCSTLADY